MVKKKGCGRANEKNASLIGIFEEKGWKLAQEDNYGKKKKKIFGDGGQN